MMQLMNTFLASMGLRTAGVPLFIVLNVFGLVGDMILRRFQYSRFPVLQKFYHYVAASLTSNYILVVKKPDKAST